MKRKSQYILFIVLFLAAAGRATAQQVIVNMAMLDGVDITPANIYNFQVVNSSGETKDATITGTIRYRNSSLRMSYTVNRRIQPGNTVFGKEGIGSPVWSYSSSALKELFFNYSKLPEGTYEYCVSLTIKGKGNESIADVQEGCVYNRSEDIFLISLIAPENNAKLYEQYPMFNWVVNYPFASELTYRIRIAAQKQGQNPQNAITRNNPIYQDNKVMSTSMIYPVTAKPLEKWQPYVWTVDAYYKGILLGGAETWRFMLVEDSLLALVPREQSYYEFDKHYGEARLFGVGRVKLKYISNIQADTMRLQLFNEKNESVKLPDSTIPLNLGDNRLDVVFYEKISLGHEKNYFLKITRGDKTAYTVPFTYINPLYVK